MRALAIDQGTTGTKAFVLDGTGSLRPVASFEHRQILPRQGWVEHDPEELLAHVWACAKAAPDADVIGIDNQGETVIGWDRLTGQPIHNAIVWQDSRTADAVEFLKAAGVEAVTLKKAGLPLDPYFSASKLKWLIDNADGARELLKAGRLCLGTSDAFFHARLGGRSFTDVTTASRTSLMNLKTLAWDQELCGLFGVPMECLPDIRPSAGDCGTFGGVPVRASLVDQQAALFGHGAVARGNAKMTFGTGAFALLNTGPSLAEGGAGMLPTVAWQIEGKAAVYAVEGGVYNAASAVNWARGLGLFGEYDEIGAFGAAPAITRGVAFVPALSGLGCPHWDRSAAGLWIGLGLETNRADLMQSLLEGIALRSAEVITKMTGMAEIEGALSVDGGMARNAYFLQFLADALERDITVPATTELTAMGAARLALLGAGCHDLPPLRLPARCFTPQRGFAARDARALFEKAVNRAKFWREA